MPRPGAMTGPQLLRRIAVRAFVTPQAVRLNRIDIERDLTTAHAHCPLNLTRLLNANDHDFFADVLGIHHNLNRATGELANGFLPRFRIRAYREAA